MVSPWIVHNTHKVTHSIRNHKGKKGCMFIVLNVAHKPASWRSCTRSCCKGGNGSQPVCERWGQIWKTICKTTLAPHYSPNTHKHHIVNNPVRNANSAFRKFLILQLWIDASILSANWTNVANISVHRQTPFISCLWNLNEFKWMCSDMLVNSNVFLYISLVYSSLHM